MNKFNEPRAKTARPHAHSESEIDRPFVPFTESIAAASVNAAVGVAANHEQSAANLELVIDCFEEAFDYMPLKGLIGVGEICERLQQVTGYCFQQNYSGVEVNFKDNHICIAHKYQADHFVQFIKKLCIQREADLEHLVRVKSNLNQLKRLEFEHIKLNETEFQIIHSISINVESLRLVGCIIPSYETFHESLLDYFPNLKHLCIVRILHNSVIIGANNKWLRQRYPKLEHLELVLFGSPVVKELRTFLELNTNIKTFFTFAQMFWANRQYMLNSDVKLNELAVYLNYDNWIDFAAFCDLLHELHTRGFYKRLHLQYFCCTSKEDFFAEMASLSALTKLYINIKSDVRLGTFHNLEEFSIQTSNQIYDFEAMPFNLPKLKRIRFAYSNLEHISMLISRAARLKKIIVNNIVDKTDSRRVKDAAINLPELNMEREQLQDAQKVTLFVPEDVYLATKWATKQTDLSLVRVCRVESFDQDNNYNLFGHNTL